MAGQSTEHRPALTALACSIVLAGLASAEIAGAAPRNPEPPKPTPSATVPSSPAPSASADAHLQEASAEWLGIAPGAQVKNNQILQINLKINANNASGSAAPRETKAAIVLKHGTFPESTAALGGVTVSPDGRTAVVDLARVPGGTAKQLTLDVRVDGETGQKLTALVTPNAAAPIELPALPIHAKTEADLVFNPDHKHWAMAPGTLREPIRSTFVVDVPVDAATVASTLSFDLTPGSTAENIFPLVEIDDSEPGGLRGPNGERITITRDEKKRAFRVVVEGISVNTMTKATVKGSDGSQVERMRTSPFRLPFVLKNAERGDSVNKTFEFTMTAGAIDIRSASGTLMTQTGHSQLTTTFWGTSSLGTIGSWFHRVPMPELVPDANNAGVLSGGHPGGRMNAQPGDQAVVVSSSGLNRGTTPERASDYVPAVGYVTIDPGYTRFSGRKIGVQIGGGPVVYYDRTKLPNFIAWSRDRLPGIKGDLRTLTYQRGGAMPDDATVIAIHYEEETFRTAKGVQKDPNSRMDNLFVPIEFIGDNLTKDFDGRVFTFSALTARDHYLPVVDAGTQPAERPLSPRYPEITGRTYRLEPVTLAPFFTVSTTTVDRPLVKQGEHAQITLTDRATSRHPQLAPNRNESHTLTSTVIIPASLALDENRLPAESRVTKREDGSTQLVYTVKSPVNRAAESHIWVTPRAFGAVATVTHTTQNVSPFINEKSDLAWATSSAEVPLDGANTTVLKKSAGAAEMAFNGRNEWVIEEVNQTSTSASHVAVVDILPYQGDDRGTRYSGAVRYAEPVVASPGVAVYYSTKNPSEIQRDPADPTNLGPTLTQPAEHWSTTLPAQGYTAVLLVQKGQAQGESLRARIPFTVEGNLPEDRYDNTAWARSGAGGLNTDLRMIRSAQSISPKEAAQLQIDKEPSPDVKALPGGELEYTVTVRNNGSTPATDVLVKDHGGQGIDASSIRFLSLPEGTRADGIAWMVGTLGAGEEKKATVRVKTTPDSAGKDAVNAITVENPRHPRDPKGECIPNMDVASDTDGCDISVIPLPPPARVQVDKSLLDSSRANTEGLLRYRVTVKNSGGVDAQNVVVTDAGGEGLDHDSITFDGAPEGTAVDGRDWTIPTLPAGESRTLDLTARRAAHAQSTPGRAINIVRVTTTPEPGAEPGTTPLTTPSAGGSSTEQCQANETVDEDTDGCDIVTTDLPAPALLKVDKTRTGDLIPETSELTYRITAKNAGGESAKDVMVKDLGGAGLEAASLSYSGVPEGTRVDGTTWHIPELAPGQSLEITVKGTLTKGSTAADNAVRIGLTTDDPARWGKSCLPNATVDDDTDQCDIERAELPIIPAAQKTTGDPAVPADQSVSGEQPVSQEEPTAANTKDGRPTRLNTGNAGPSSNLDGQAALPWALGASGLLLLGAAITAIRSKRRSQ
jgi:uncharacterized repeat protein (TIGR01451 family)